MEIGKHILKVKLVDMNKTRFVRVRTKNYTAESLRKSIETDSKVIVRLGSRTPVESIFIKNPRNVIEINTTEAVENSRDKLKMKACFQRLSIPQAEHLSMSEALEKELEMTDFPYVGKAVVGFKGHGMRLLNNSEELRNFIHSNNSGFFIEKFYNYAREYRLHVAKDIGVFMSWRKLRTADTTERWFFNSTNSNWISPEHELFDRPSCWKKMEKAAIDALESTGLDIGAVDIRVQSNSKKDPKFIVCEINSAPALGEQGVQIYRNTIKQLINLKKHEISNM